MSETNSARKRNHPSSESLDSMTPSDIAQNLPPPRRSRPLASVSPPLKTTSLHRLIYLLVILMALSTALYSYKIFQHKKAVGGWWNLAMGRAPHAQHLYGSPAKDEGGRGSIEDKINDLAFAFGMPAHELASAIAVAVRNHVPPASLSSISERETGTIVQVLLKGGGEETEGDVKQAKPTSTPGVVESVLAQGFENFVGMDEP